MSNPPSIVSVGTPIWQHTASAGTTTPVWPAGYTPTVGDRACIYTTAGNNNGTCATPPGFTPLPAAANAPTRLQAVFFKDLQGGDTLPAVPWVNSGGTSSICVVLRGDLPPMAQFVENGVTRSSNATQAIPTGAVSVANANDFLMFFGMRLKTSTGNGETVGVLPTFTAFAPANVPSGADIVSTIQYCQQTAPTNLALSSINTSIADTSNTCQGFTLVLKTQAAPTASFTSPPTVQSASAIPNGAYTLAFTAAVAGTFYAVAVAAGSTAPTAAQIEAGQDSTGADALASVSKAVTTAATTAVLGGALALPLYDLYCVLHTTVDSPIVSLLGQFLMPTAGRQLVTITGLASAGQYSILTGATPPAVAGDIIECDLVTAPDGFALSMSTTGIPEYSGTGARESFAARVYQRSSATWSALVTNYVNNSPPIFSPGFLPFAYGLNVAITPVDLRAGFTDPNGDNLTITATTAMPPGLFISASKLAGAGTLQGVYPVTLQAQDLAGDTVPGPITIIVGNVQVPKPLIGLLEADADTAIKAAFLTPQSVLVPSSDQPGTVIDVTPKEGDFAAPFSPVVLSIATPLPGGGGSGGGTGGTGGSGSGNPPPPPPIQNPGSIVARLTSVDLKLSDLSHFWGQDLTLSNTQDVELASDSERSQQRVLRRLLTNPGDYVFQPTYGAGLLKYVGNTSDVPGITALIRSQILLEDSVAKDPAPQITVSNLPNSSDGSALLITIVYTDSTTGASQTLSFSLEK